MSAANFQNVIPLGRLGLQRFRQRMQRRRQIITQTESHTDMEHRWNYIIRGLPEVDVVVRVQQSFGSSGMPRELLGTVGDHLVGVGVGRGRGSGLEYIDWEVG